MTSRNEILKKKELEEARKAGTAPAEVDEEGNDINPHIPQYMQKVPWYFDKEGAPSLKHQKILDKSSASQAPTAKRRRVVGQSTSFRDGACSNCGALTHQRKDCTERIRKVGAKFDPTNISADIVVEESQDLDWDAKHDDWAGCDTEEHHRMLLERHRALEDARNLLATAAPSSSSSSSSSTATITSSSTSTPDHSTTPSDAPVEAPSKPVPLGTLRDRNVLPKYLRNLDPNSAHFDPKTRSMRANPNPDTESDYYGDNWLKQTGDAKEFSLLQAHLLMHRDQSDPAARMPIEALPTAQELAFQKFLKDKESESRSDIQALESLYCSSSVTDLTSDEKKILED